MGGARRFGPPRPSQQVSTYSVMGKEVLQLERWEQFNSAPPVPPFPSVQQISATAGIAHQI
jgi:hypothetical protein